MSQDLESAVPQDHDAAPEDQPADVPSAKLVPIAESIKYRRRAQQAETRLQQLQQQLADVQAQLDKRLDEVAAAEAQRDETHHRLAETETRLQAERLMNQAGVIDPDAAWLLLTQRLDLADSIEPKALAEGLQQLLLDKPFLRAPQAPLPPKTASPRSGASLGRELSNAADRAVRTGDRRDIIQYLRLRRQSELARSDR